MKHLFPQVETESVPVRVRHCDTTVGFAERASERAFFLPTSAQILGALEAGDSFQRADERSPPVRTASWVGEKEQLVGGRKAGREMRSRRARDEAEGFVRTLILFRILLHLSIKFIKH